jgi:hypothetical protein
MGLGSPLDLEQVSGPVPYPLTKVMWVLGPNYSGQVTLKGKDIRTAAPLWLQLAGNGNDNPELASPSVVLDAAAPNRGSTTNSLGHWSIFGVLIYFTSAGCYSLDVTWQQGHWRTVFAAGR